MQRDPGAGPVSRPLTGRSFGSAADMISSKAVQLHLNAADASDMSSGSPAREVPDSGTYAPAGTIWTGWVSYRLGASMARNLAATIEHHDAVMTYPHWTGLLPFKARLAVIGDAAGNLFVAAADGHGLSEQTGGRSAATVVVPAAPLQSIRFADLAASVPGNRRSPARKGIAQGSRVRTLGGDVDVEALRPGMMVCTLDHGPQPVRWIASEARAAEGDHAPVVIGAGVLGNPRDLIVASRQRILLRGWRAELYFGQTEVLVPAGELIDGDRIRLRPGGMIRQFQLLLDQHEILFFDDVPGESLLITDAALDSLGPRARAVLLADFPRHARSDCRHVPTWRRPPR